MSDSRNLFPGIMRLAERFQGILLDAYGVFWGGNAFGPLPGAKEAMEALILRGKTVGVLSNSTQPAAKEKDKLQQHGVIEGRHYHFLTTSGEVARQTFLNKAFPFPTPRHSFWLLGGIHPHFASHEPLCRDTPYHVVDLLEDADFIYTAVPHIGGEDQVDPELFRANVEALIGRRLPMFCPNPDLFAHEGKPPRVVVRQGSIAAFYEAVGGQVFYIGKPYTSSYDAAMGHFQRHRIEMPSAILMVGDTPETDIRGARRYGMASALVTETGMMAERIRHDGWQRALDALALEDRPDYLIGRLIDDIHAPS